MSKENKKQDEKENCEGCAFFTYKASRGHGWCYDKDGQYSGKIKGNGRSCRFHTGHKVSRLITYNAFVKSVQVECKING